MKRLSLLCICLMMMQLAYSQTATLTGTVKDKKDNAELIGVNVIIKGTSLGAVTDVNGKFVIKNIKHGEYTIELSYIGYNKTLLTGIKLGPGETKELQVSLIPTSVTSEDVVIIGKKPLIDIDKAQSVHSIGSDMIELAPARQLQSIVNTQPGVIQGPAGVSIRGGRTYETGVYVDGVKVTDPLGGTGFGLDIGSNAINDVDVTTGGIGADIGDATAGVINTKTKNGGDKIDLGVSYKRDNFGFNKDYKSCWNSQVAELNLSGPLFKTALSNRLKFSIALRGAFTDEYYKNPANQLYSSLYPGSDGKNTLWSPYQDNRWSAFLKLNYHFKGGKVLTVSQLRSLTMNQDVNMLRIFGNDLPFSPGYQYDFSEQMDHANTYTHDSYLTSINWKQSINKRFSYDATLSHFFVRLRADANGRPWRPDLVVNQLDPQSINQYPNTYFNQGDNIAYVNNPSGFYNNNGIATLWHDHYFVENALKAVGNYTSKNSMNNLSFGFEMKFQEMQWIDVIRPWVGAPLPLPDGTMSQTYRLGQQSDIWKVNPQRGGIFVSDVIKYRGLVASIGGRFEYWAPGKYVDDAVANPKAPILDEVRQSYLDHTTKIGGLRYKFRFLPKLSASFPIRENQMLYFNYGHTTILPHPSYIYPGLNPYYQDRSTIANVGNPDLNPEVDISYEIGLKTQITSNDALTFSAFWKDKYDFITSTSILIPDATGREVARTMRINSAYARTRGIELGYIKRIGTWYNGQAGITYMVTTGQSSSANEAVKEILATGAAEDTKEFYLPWDCPIDFKTNHTFKIDRKEAPYGKKILNQWSVYFETVMRSGVRYTPYHYAYDDPNTGRPIYTVSTNPNDKWSKVGEYWFWADLTVSKWWKVKSTRITLNLTITNLFDNKNASIINPVTGRAYEYGDDVPDTWVDPRYNNPKQGTQGPPPTNPARYLQQRHIVTGIAIRF